MRNKTKKHVTSSSEEDETDSGSSSSGSDSESDTDQFAGLIDDFSYAKDAKNSKDKKKNKRKRESEESATTDDEYVPNPRLSKELEAELARRARSNQKRALTYNLRAPRIAPTMLYNTIQRRRRSPQTKQRKIVTIEPPPFKVTDWSSLLQLIRLTKALPSDKMFRDCETLPPLLEPLESIDKLIGL